MKDIKDYIGKKQVAIYCSTQNEWESIAKLLNRNTSMGYPGMGDCFVIEVNGNNTKDKSFLERQNFTIYPASDFLKFKSSEQDILEQCNKKYPIGTKYRCPIGNTIVEVKGKFFKGSTGNEFTDGYGGYVYYEGKFAEIIEEESKFEEGKWYKYSDKDNHYFKPLESKIIGNYVKTSEEIHTGVYRNANNTWFSTNEAKLADLSEIQQYLPNGHVDKIKIIPEYVECIEELSNQKVGDIEKTSEVPKWSYGWSKDSFWDTYYKKYYKPSTKEAFDKQNNIMEKWSIGTYVVALKDRAVNINRFNSGDVAIINRIGSIKLSDNSTWHCSELDEKNNSVKWFATKSEAEAFSKTLITNEEWIPKVGDWCITTIHYNNEIWYKGRIWQIGKIDKDGFYIPIENGRFLSQSLKTGFRKALPHEIPIENACKEIPKSNNISDYVKCIKTINSSFTLNKIYKIESNSIRTNTGYLCSDNIRNNLSNYYGYSFEYSNEQEYLVQEGKQIHEKVVSNIQVGKSYSIIDELPNTIGIIKYFGEINFSEDLVSTGNKVIKKETLTELELPTPIKVIKREESYY